MGFSFRQLRVFAAAAQELHFGNAAETLGMQQPPFSQALQKLEADLGVRLLTRSAQGVALTEQGARLLPLTQQILHLEETLMEEARRVPSAQRQIRFGCPPELARPIIFDIISAVSAKGVSVEFTTSPTRQIIQDLRQGELDVGVITAPAVITNLTPGPVVKFAVTLRSVPGTKYHYGSVGSAQELRQVIDRPLALAPRSSSPAFHDLLVDTLKQHGAFHGVSSFDDADAAVASVVQGKHQTLSIAATSDQAGLARIIIDPSLLPYRFQLVAGPTPSSDASMVMTTASACMNEWARK